MNLAQAINPRTSAMRLDVQAGRINVPPKPKPLPEAPKPVRMPGDTKLVLKWMTGHPRSTFREIREGCGVEERRFKSIVTTLFYGKKVVREGVVKKYRYSVAPATETTK